MIITPTFQRNFARKFNDSGRVAAASAVSTVQTMGAKADLVYARSLLMTKHLKGDIGEFFAGRFFLDQELAQNYRGNWCSLTPRVGRQGLDHLYMRMDNQGRLHWMVGESKYGTSQLGNTMDGQQMSPAWIHKRLQRLGMQYKQIALADNIDFQRPPEIASDAGYKQFEVWVNGKKCVFWRNGSDPADYWHFSGSKNDMDAAQKMAAKMGRDLLSPNCHVRGGFIFRINPQGNDLVITLERVNTAGNSNTVEKLSRSTTMVVKDILDKNISDAELKKQIAEALHKKMPHLSEAEIKELTNDFAHLYKHRNVLQSPPPLWQSITWQSLSAAGIAGVIDAGIQFFSTRKVELGRTLLTAGGAGIGTATGQVINILLLKTTVGNQMVRSVASLLNVSSSLTRSALSGLGGGVVTSVIMAYGGALMGYTDWQQAHRVAFTGTASSLIGAAVYSGVPALVAEFGSSGTGLAISSLHGAAASQAVLAWLGGGTVASGGAGVAGGAIVLGGIVAVTTIVASVAITYGFMLHDEAEQRRYTLLLFKSIDHPEVWNRIAELNCPGIQA